MTPFYSPALSEGNGTPGLGQGQQNRAVDNNKHMLPPPCTLGPLEKIHPRRSEAFFLLFNITFTFPWFRFDFCHILVTLPTSHIHKMAWAKIFRHLPINMLDIPFEKQMLLLQCDFLWSNILRSLNKFTIYIYCKKGFCLTLMRFQKH